jgi:hypothetical protein
MGQALLVTVDIPLGAEVLSALDTAGLDPKVVMWAYFSDYEDWRLVIASRHFDGRSMRECYRLIIKAMDAAGISSFRAPEVFVCPMDEPFIKRLRRIFGKAAGTEGMRLGGQRIGNRCLEDAYVYRIV